jgi:hypothetical protein
MLNQGHESPAAAFVSVSRRALPVAFGFRREGVARLNPDTLESHQAVAFVPLVIGAQGQLAPNKDAGRQRLL